MATGIYAFVLIEYIQFKGFVISQMSTEKIIYTRETKNIILDRKEAVIPNEILVELLDSSNLDLEDFKSFLSSFIDSEDYKIAKKNSIIKRAD